jgi:hypothetical protein
MPSELTFEDLQTHIVCRYTGPYRFPDIADAAHSIAEQCSSRNSFRVLIDIRGSHGELSVSERYQVANEMAHRWDPRLRLALLGRPDQRLPDRPWEVTAVERGIPAKVFTEEESAVQWLLS